MFSFTCGGSSRNMERGFSMSDASTFDDFLDDPRQVPIFMKHSRPLPYRQCYLHIIRTEPTYEKPKIARQIFCDELMSSNEYNFGILTLKPWPSTLCQFPVYSDLGEIRIKIETNIQILYFNEQNLKDISEFHKTLFLHIMRAVRKCYAYDVEGNSNGYFLVPLKTNEKTRKIQLAWSCIKKKFPTTITKPSDEEIEKLDFTRENYLGKVVTPWFKPGEPFIVCDVSDEVYLHSKFVSKDYKTYEHYFHTKHNLESKRPAQQPMLSVRPITCMLDGIKPKPISTSEKMRRKTKCPSDTNTYLAPEFCYIYSFPSVFWYKSIILPSVLHRVYYLFLAEELRQQFVSHARVGSLILPRDDSEDTVKHFKEIENKAELSTSPINPPKVRKHTVSMRICNLLYPKRRELEKRIEKVTNGMMRDVKKNTKYMDTRSFSLDNGECSMVLEAEKMRTKYFHFASTTPLKVLNVISDESFSFDKAFQSTSYRTRINFEPSPELSTLREYAQEDGPKPHQILEALTLRDAQDVIHLERLETLGDSCLKYLISVYAYTKFEDMNEGHLSILRSHLVSNKNLFCCGKNMAIGSYVKATNFQTKTVWCPPGFSIPRCFTENQSPAHVSSPSALLALDIPLHEQFSGRISSDTMEQVINRDKEIRSAENSENTNKEVDFLLGQHTLMRKNISDVIEALLGVYIRTVGVKGCFKLLKHFGILEQENLDTLFDPPTEVDGSNDYIYKFLPNYKDLEDLCNYKFKNKAYLLQAFTHPSYPNNQLTQCYQRLEYIGDAVLDFLITSYIYEYCGNLDPGQLTDLRSSLVNNVTFGALSIRLGLHRYILCNNHHLMETIESFAKYQKNRNYEINKNELMSLINENQRIVAEEIDVPKALGDVFESLAGAIFVDSGYNLVVVWNVYYSIMKKEINEFSKNIPINPVRALYEKTSVKPVFSTLRSDGDNLNDSKFEVFLNITNSDETTRQFIGRGETLKAAKRAAAKYALKSMNLNTFFI